MRDAMGMGALCLTGGISKLLRGMDCLLLSRSARLVRKRRAVEALDRILLAAIDADDVARQPVEARVREHGDGLGYVLWSGGTAAGVAQLDALQQLHALRDATQGGRIGNAGTDCVGGDTHGCELEG